MSETDLVGQFMYYKWINQSTSVVHMASQRTRTIFFE